MAYTASKKDIGTVRLPALLRLPVRERTQRGASRFHGPMGGSKTEQGQMRNSAIRMPQSLSILSFYSLLFSAVRNAENILETTR